MSEEKQETEETPARQGEESGMLVDMRSTLFDDLCPERMLQAKKLRLLADYMGNVLFKMIRAVEGRTAAEPDKVRVRDMLTTAVVMGHVHGCADTLEVTRDEEGRKIKDVTALAKSSASLKSALAKLKATQMGKGG